MFMLLFVFCIPSLFRNIVSIFAQIGHNDVAGGKKCAEFAKSDVIIEFCTTQLVLVENFRFTSVFLHCL